ncbi:MAG: 6-carboxytetrahydropterin synthase [Candidatus Melainabacteria bacterium]
MLALSRKYDFSATHRLYNPAFADEKNWEIFQLCNNPNGHGHNYELDVMVTGELDPETGMLVDLVALDTLVQSVLITRLDHKNLNLDVDFLKDAIPTAEVIVYACWQQLAPALKRQFPHARLQKLRLLETKKNFAEYSEENA